MPHDPAVPPSESASADTAPREREYEKSGCYPGNGRPFRIWALLGGLSLVIVLLALVSVLLNFLLI